MLTKAQGNDQKAIDELCERFKPLVYKEAYRSNIFNALGEDAVNVAWTIFLSFTRRYNGADYLNLPGLIQCHLRYELLHAVKAEGEKWDNTIVSEELLENQTYDPMDKVTTDLALQEVLKKLSPRQLDIIDQYYQHGKTNENIAKQMGCSIRHVKRQKAEALSSIKENFIWKQN